MAQVISDRRDVDFVLFEQMEVEKLTKHEKFAEFNKKTVDLIVSEARNLAVKELLPLQEIGDKEGCKFENGKVSVPKGFHKAYKIYREGEWLAMADDPEVGGQGMPKTVSLAASEYFTGANCAFMLYNGLTHGAGKLVEEFGTEKQKELFLGKMYSGEWSGTMLLTESEAGSDVGALTTSAKKNDDGTYSITGAKIFISGGDHDLVKNIIHPVLARVEGAPEGTRGISLFLVPKYRVNDDGSLGEFNDVVCTGIEEKTGIHGNSTCSLTLGGKNECIGTLLGKENEGMRNMFVMMNEARHLVGLQGFSVSTAAYMHALNYARERVQSKSLTDPRGESVAIIKHPDVRRQLMLMKSFTEGMRSLIYFTGLCYDKIKISDDDQEKAELSGLIEVLTPIVKGYITDKALEVTSHGVQIYGGYGFTKDYPAEQLFRDCRIFMLYEGTNGIQAMDLLGRKLGLNKGESFKFFLSHIKKTIDEAKETNILSGLADTLEAVYDKTIEAALLLGKTAGSKNVEHAFALAHPFLEVSGDMTMAWMLLWRATISAKKLEKIAGSLDAEKIKEKVKSNKNASYYDGQLKSADFFINSILPVTLGKIDAITKLKSAAVDIADSSFGG